MHISISVSPTGYVYILFFLLFWRTLTKYIHSWIQEESLAVLPPGFHACCVTSTKFIYSTWQNHIHFPSPSTGTQLSLCISIFVIIMLCVT